MAHSIPKVHDTSLHISTIEGSSTSVITLGSAEWYTWLEHSPSFRFETPHSTFTARKEQRPGGWYWYAYRHHHGKLHIAYLGKSEELAAARIKFLSPQALLARLDHRLQVLTSGARDLPERQQTLRNTIQWSYELLNTQEQRLFWRLSVFVGGCTLEAIETVCAALGASTLHVLDSLTSLLDKSLLQSVEQRQDEPRFFMLEAIREYGQECLKLNEEEQITRHAHASYYLAVLEKVGPNLHGPEQRKWLDLLERENNNLRAALQWSIERKDVELALQLSNSLSWFWHLRGNQVEGRQWLDRVLAASEGARASLR